MIQKTKFIHFTCRNTKKLDLVVSKLGQKQTCVTVQLGFMQLFLMFLKNPTVLLKFSGKKSVFEYYKNNYLKTIIRLPTLFSITPLRWVYKLSFDIKTKLTYSFLERAFKTRSFEAVLIWGGAYLPQTILKELCEIYKKQTLFFEVSSLPGKIQVDPQGVNFNSSLSRSPNFYKNLLFTHTETLPTEIGFRSSKLTHQKALAELPENYIFVPFQVPSDSQILDHSSWIKNMVHFYEILDEVSKLHPSITFVIKEHPSFKLSIQGRVSKNENIKFANSYETKKLIEDSSGVITINSSVGLEALILSKKVIVLGQVNYDLEGLVLRASNINELSKALGDISSWKFDEDLRKSFLRYFSNRYLVQGDYDNLNLETVEKCLSKLASSD